MKATDLMLGDWVLVHSHIDKLAKVEGIYEKSIYTSIGGPWLYDEVEPIPLTAEILEKNGFVEHRDGFYATEQEQLAGDGFVVRNMVYYKSGTLSVVTERGEIGIGIKFIHQLQHALRLCRIDKEIII